MPSPEFQAAEAAVTALEASLAGEATIVDAVIAFIDAQNAQLAVFAEDAAALPGLQARIQAQIDANEAHKNTLAAKITTVVPPEGGEPEPAPIGDIPV